MSESMLVGGTVLTMDRVQPRAEAVLWRGGTIVAVGSEAEVRAVASPDVTITDVGGRAVVPGFNDAHIHLTALGARESALDLTGLSKQEIIEAVKESDAGLPAGEPLFGYNWDYPSCPDPHLRDLDAAVPDRVVALFQFSGHGAWVNSAALRLLGFNRDTPDWGLGGPDRDPDGELNGVIRELGQARSARRLYRKQIGNRKIAEDQARIGLERLREHGITSIQDNTWFSWVVAALQNIHRAGDLTCRISCWSPGFLPPFEFLFALKRFREHWYERGPRKYFLDGAFSSHTAWLAEAYSDKPETAGAGKSREQILPMLRRAIRQNRQIACHSIGDAATTAYVEAVEETGAETAIELRHRIEHGQLIDPGDFEKIARLGMIVSAQPHAAATPEKDRGLLGSERAKRAYAYRSMLDAGVHLAFGSDFPGESTYDPLFGIHLAVNRDGGEGISAEEALACYTTGSAYAEFKEDTKGLIKAGYVCDLAVLSADPTAVKPQTIKDISVDMTIVDGAVVYEKPSANKKRGRLLAKATPVRSSRYHPSNDMASTVIRNS